MNVLSVKGVTKRFGGLLAVDEVSFDVAEGVIKGLIGPNGAGKSTLFDLISGFTPVNSGAVLFNGTDITNKGPETAFKAGIARTFQHTSLFEDMTVKQNLLVALLSTYSTSFLRTILFGATLGSHVHEAEQTAELYLRRFDLVDWSDSQASALPAGLRRKVELVRAAATEPALIMLDEPAAGLNPTETKSLAKDIELVRNHGASVLVVEHDLNFVMALCDDIVVLDHGKKIAEGAPHIISRDPSVIEAYLGGFSTVNTVQ